jgi:hypothetical protein
MVPATVKQTQDVPATFWPYASKVHAANGQAVAFEPPTNMPTGGTVTLTATSTADPSQNATQTVSITSTLTGPALSGKVQVGTLPVAGAQVQLLAAGSTGYGSQAQALKIGPNGSSSVTAGPDGSFTIPAGYCPSLNTLLYLVATGGNAGGPQQPANAQLGLMTAIGSCSDLDANTPLVVNEVTTVASVFALAPFIVGDYSHIGASASNYNNGPNLSNAANNNNGLANAFATVNNLVDITTGEALALTPAGNGTVPQAEINTLADAINTCAATAGFTQGPGDGSACDAFVEAANVNPPDGAVSTSSNAPTSILQAIIEVAQVPSTQRVSSNSSILSGLPLYSLVTNPSYTPPFKPVLTSAPYDWSIALSFTGAGLDGLLQARPLSSSLALDAAGNVWISNRNISSVTELSNAGAALSPFATGTTRAAGGGFTGGGLTTPRAIAIDPYGEAWILNGNNTVSELAFNGAPLSGSTGFSGGGNLSNTGAGLAVDGNGNVWVADSGAPGDVAEYAGYNGGPGNLAPGAPLSPPGTGFGSGFSDKQYAPFNHALFNPNGTIAVDGSNNIWLLDQGNYAAVELSSTAGQLLDTDQGDFVDSQSRLPLTPPVYLLSASNFGASMAIDNAGDLFIPTNIASVTGPGQAALLYELSAGGSSANFGGIGQEIAPSIASIYPPLAIDGLGRQWAIVEPNINAPILEPFALAELSSSGGTLNSNYRAQGFVASTLTASVSAVAVDASGSVWVLCGGSQTTVTEFVGVASPVVTPLSLAVQNAQNKKPGLGTRP